MSLEVDMQKIMILLALLLTATVHAQFTPELATIQATNTGVTAFAVTSGAPNAIGTLKAYLEGLTLPHGAVIAVVLNETTVLVRDAFTVRQDNASAQTYLNMARGTQRNLGRSTVTASQVSIDARTNEAQRTAARGSYALRQLEALNQAVIGSIEIVEDGQMSLSVAQDVYINVSQSLRDFDCAGLIDGSSKRGLLESSHALLIMLEDGMQEFLPRSFDVTPITRCL